MDSIGYLFCEIGCEISQFTGITHQFITKRLKNNLYLQCKTTNVLTQTTIKTMKTKTMLGYLFGASGLLLLLWNASLFLFDQGNDSNATLIGMCLTLIAAGLLAKKESANR